MKIMYVTSECAPFIKTGGLGDVAGSLPKALAAKGHDVRVFCPLYSAISEEMPGKKFFYIKNALCPSRLAQPVLRHFPLRKGRRDLLLH